MASSYVRNMKRSLIALCLVLSCTLTGCFSSKAEELAVLAGDMICLADQSIKEMRPFLGNEEKMGKKKNEIEQKIREKVSAAGYEDEQALEADFRAHKDEQRFRDQTKIEVLKKCQDAQDMLDTFFTDLDK